ncbi:hypothetical protein T265_07623 [Opisthorchis viverrini]|uniref:Ribosomal protein L20 n=1 Tax=Opisthorchis viverrini TaxID=6198 RepID=A0A075AB23_OPIVI|nr:hypothetical protein T265_07623 [Opisthorchis viverrini]KER24794.1 hypothetical protein T265_07623 [Opisthorchis viverrini]
MKLTDILFMRKVVPFGTCDPWFKRNQLMKFAFNYRGRLARCHKLGMNRVYKALQFVQALRDARKEEIHDIWNQRIAIASEQHGLPGRRILLEGLAQSNVALNKNMLQLLAIYEPRTFEALVNVAKQYHSEVGVNLPASDTSVPVISRGMLRFPIVPGNKHLYD